MRDRDFEALWSDATPGPPFRAAEVEGLPPAARRYFTHAIAEGTPRASAVRLSMRGEIRLKDEWEPFEAEQVIRAHRGFVWRATVRMKGISVKGSDRFVDGRGAVRWKLLGIIPVARAEGPEIARSAAGRAQIEGIWLPSALLEESLDWERVDATHAAARVRVGDHASRVELSVDDAGRLRAASMLRWGTPGGVDAPQEQAPFGCVVEDEGTFDGVTIPTLLRVGWYFGTERFEGEGVFFRCEVERAEFR